MNLKTIGEIILFLWNTGILTAVAYAASRFFIAHTKNKNLLQIHQRQKLLNQKQRQQMSKGG